MGWSFSVDKIKSFLLSIKSRWCHYVFLLFRWFYLVISSNFFFCSFFPEGHLGMNLHCFRGYDILMLSNSWALSLKVALWWLWLNICPRFLPILDIYSALSLIHFWFMLYFSCLLFSLLPRNLEGLIVYDLSFLSVCQSLCSCNLDTTFNQLLTHNLIFIFIIES